MQAELALQAVLTGSSVRNLIADSGNFSSDEWIKYRCTITPNVGPDPDGGNGAFDLIDTAGGPAYCYVYQQHYPDGPPTYKHSYDYIPNSRYTFSITAAPRDQHVLWIEPGGTNEFGEWFDCLFDLNTGECNVGFFEAQPPSYVITPVAKPFHGGFLGQKMTALPNGFWLCQFSFLVKDPYFSPGTSTEYASFTVAGTDSMTQDGNQSYVGTGGPAIRLYRSQLTRAPYLVDYKETVGAFNPPIDTRAEDRVYAVQRPQNGLLPAVTYQRVSFAPMHSLSGSSYLSLARMQINCWAASLKDVKLLAAEVRAVMDAAAFDGTLKNRPDGSQVEFDESVSTYRASLDFLCWER